jgi:hypothetical protein
MRSNSKAPIWRTDAQLLGAHQVKSGIAKWRRTWLFHLKTNPFQWYLVIDTTISPWPAWNCFIFVSIVRWYSRHVNFARGKYSTPIRNQTVYLTLHGLESGERVDCCRSIQLLTNVVPSRHVGFIHVTCSTQSTVFDLYKSKVTPTHSSNEKWGKRKRGAFSSPSYGRYITICISICKTGKP